MTQLRILRTFTRALLALCSAAAILLTNGCAVVSDDGPYQGDSALFNADQTIVNSYELLHTFVKWEYDHRAALAPVPQIKQAADRIRSEAPGWFQTAHTLRDAYAASPSRANKKAFLASIDVIRAALTEATKYLTQYRAAPFSNQ